MDISNSTSLAKVSEAVNHAHFFNIEIDKEQADKAIDWITSRYKQHLPASVLAQSNPDPRWAAVPKSFVLTESDQATRLTTFTGEPVKGASMRAIHSREAARALLILAEITGRQVPEAHEHCLGVRYTADGLAEKGLPLFCCGPCTVSVLRLINIGGLGECDDTTEHLLAALPRHRDDKGTWRRFPFFFTLSALIDMDRTSARRELEYALPAAEKKLKRLKPDEDISKRRISVLNSVMEACS